MRLPADGCYPGTQLGSTVLMPTGVSVSPLPNEVPWRSTHVRTGMAALRKWLLLRLTPAHTVLVLS